MTATLTPTELLPIAAIEPWSHNVRGQDKFTPEALAELVESIKLRGQDHPITVRRHPTKPNFYQVGDGHRRWSAMQMAEYEKIEARVRVLNEEEMFKLVFASGSEGLTVPLTPIEEAKGYRDAMNTVGCSIHEFAKRFVPEKSVQHVYHRLALLDLPEAALKALKSGDLPSRAATAIGMIPDAAQREAVTELALKHRDSTGVMPLKQLERHIRDNVYVVFRRGGFDPEDAALTKAGVCSACEFHVPAEKPGGVATCRRPSCFQEKVAAARAKIVEREVKAGKHALPVDNATVYPPGGSAIAPDCGFVDFNRPVPMDLVKKEVLAQGRVPTWAALCEGQETQPKVYVTFDQQGRLVDLVKLEEALLAAAAAECAIFNTETIKRHKLERTEQAQKEEKHSRRSGESGGRPAAASDASAEDEDASEPEAGAEAPALPLNLFLRLAHWIGHALEKAPTLPPDFRAEGFQLMREAGLPTLSRVKDEPAPPSAATEPEPAAAVTSNPDTLAAWVKARAGGMSIETIASSYGATLDDVRGALGEKAPEPAPAPQSKPAKDGRAKPVKLTREEQVERAKQMHAAGEKFADIFLATKMPRRPLTKLLAELDAKKA